MKSKKAEKGQNIKKEKRQRKTKTSRKYLKNGSY